MVCTRVATIILLAIGALGTSGLEPLTVGTPGVSFHQVANWVIVRGLERLGYNVTVIDQLPHRYMYPNFTGSSGFAATIDLVTGSDLPFNHIVYLGPTKYDPDQNPPWQPPANWQPKDWSVIGSTNEATDIILASASHTVTKTSDLKTAPASFSRQIIGLDQDTCPACVKNGENLIKALGESWEYVQHNASAFVLTVSSRISAGDSEFVAVWYVPTYLNSQITGLNEIDGYPWPRTTHNQGKIIIRNDRIYKLTAKARNFLGAAFIGNKNIVQMDEWAQDTSPMEATDKWIAQNPEAFEMFLGKFNVQ